MPYSVRCKACSASFAIPDEIWDKRVRGRVATLKCRSCKADIQVDGTKEGVSQPSAAPPPASLAPAASKTSSAPSSPPVAEPSGSAPTVTDSSPMASEPHEGALASPAAGPIAGAAGLGHKPLAKAAQEIAAADVGWSLMPPPGDLEKAGLAPKAAASPTKGQLAQPPVPTVVSAPGAAAGARVAPALAEVKPATGSAARAAPASTVSAASAANAPSTPPLSVPPELIEESPADPDLWVVSYGEDDDRELTENEIAAELQKGKITLSTIVWQEGMPEWLPISGVKALAKFAPQQRPAPARQLKGSRVPAQSTKSATVAAAAGKPSSAVPPLPQVQRDKQASHDDLGAPAQLKTAEHGAKPASKVPSQAQAAYVADAKAADAKAGKAPPPLSRAGEKPGPGSRVPVPRATDQRNLGPAAGGPTTDSAATDGTGTGGPATSGAGTSHIGQKPGSRVPALPRHSQAGTTSPWADDASDEVVTSAPLVGTPAVVPSAPQTTAGWPLTPGQSSASAASAPVAVASGQITAPAAPLASAPSHATAPAASLPSAPAAEKASAKSSLRPPKPVETATSLVMRTEVSRNQDLLITDDDFLAMQRRFPKWALPAAIAGGLVVIGLIVVAATSGEEPPPLPVAPVAPTEAALRENPANQASPRHPQPNLDAMPTAAAAKSDEKDFARLFAQSASKTNGSFDSKAAELAANNVMELAARCRVAPDPAGAARAVVTFATAGQVLSVQLGSPYGGTTTGKCVERVLRTIKVRPFQGEPGRLPLTVPIH